MNKKQAKISDPDLDSRYVRVAETMSQRPLAQAFKLWMTASQAALDKLDDDERATIATFSRKLQIAGNPLGEGTSLVLLAQLGAWLDAVMPDLSRASQMPDLSRASQRSIPWIMPEPEPRSNHREQDPKV